MRSIRGGWVSSREGFLGDTGARVGMGKAWDGGGAEGKAGILLDFMEGRGCEMGRGLRPGWEFVL